MYYLSDLHDYFGTSMKDNEEIITVMDFNKKTMFMYGSGLKTL